MNKNPEYSRISEEQMEVLISGNTTTLPTAPKLGETTWSGVSASEVKYVYHPHSDTIRIRVLEELLERLMSIVEKDPDSGSEIIKLRLDLQHWREELRESKVVDRHYSTNVTVDYNSLPFKLNVSGLPSNPASVK